MACSKRFHVSYRFFFFFFFPKETKSLWHYKSLLLCHGLLRSQAQASFLSSPLTSMNFCFCLVREGAYALGLSPRSNWRVYLCVLSGPTPTSETSSRCFYPLLAFFAFPPKFHASSTRIFFFLLSPLGCPVAFSM